MKRVKKSIFQKLFTSLLALTMAGNLFAVSNWESDRKYVKGDEVVYNGALWQAKWWSEGNTPENGVQSPWQEVYEDIVSPWSATTVYTEGDQIILEGKVWEAKWWNEGRKPELTEGNPWSFITDINLEITNSGETEISLSVTDSIADTNFNKIVSLPVPIPAGWQFVESTQGMVHTDVVAVENGVAHVTAIPENGTLTLRKEDTGEYLGYTGRVVDNDSIIADYFYNKFNYNKRPLLLLSGSDGGKSWSSPMDKQNRRDLVKRGYAALSIAYFGLPGLPETLERVPVEFFEDAKAWFESQRGVNSSDFAVMGASKGGELSLLLATIYPEIKSVVALVPASNVFVGIGPQNVSSWSYQGAEVPYASLIYNETFQKALETNVWEPVYSEAIADPAVAEGSAIPVEKMNASLFLLSGKQDHMWPSFDMSERIMTRLTENQYPHHYEHVTSEYAGHYVAFYPEYWALVLNYLETHYPVEH